MASAITNFETRQRALLAEASKELSEEDFAEFLGSVDDIVQEAKDEIEEDEDTEDAMEEADDEEDEDEDEDDQAEGE